MPASSRPTRRRIWVAQTNGMANPTSQTSTARTPPPQNEPPVSRRARRKRTVHDGVSDDGSAIDSNLTDFAQMLSSSRPTRRRRISVPETSAMTDPASQSLNRHKREIVGLVINDLGLSDKGRDLVVQDHASNLQKIKETHCKFMAMQYPILFPYGEDGFHEKLEYHQCHRSTEMKRKNVTMLEFYTYRLHDRPTDFNTPLRGKKLTQAYIVDAYCCVEDSRLSHFRKDSFQAKYRTATYKSLVQSVSSGVTEASAAGQRVYLPGSFIGGPRWYYQNYQDCVALCRRYGCPELFVTFTCNAAWPEIAQALSAIPGQHPSDRPDIVDRVFQLKLNLLMDDITKHSFFGPILGGIRTMFLHTFQSCYTLCMTFFHYLPLLFSLQWSTQLSSKRGVCHMYTSSYGLNLMAHVHLKKLILTYQPSYLIHYLIRLVMMLFQGS